MKTGKLALAALLLTGAGVASAHGRRGGPSPEMIKQFDKNGDGQLNEVERAELRARHEAMRAEKLKAYDANGNGSLDEVERQKLHADRAAERFKALDKNGDGALSLAEFQAGKAMHGRRGPAR